MTANKLSFGDFYTLVWSMVPAVWRETDNEYGKSLQVLLYTMAQHMYYYFYEKAVYMDELFDPDKCPEKYLQFLASMVSWKLIGSDAAAWREQIKAAPLLHKLRGTQRGLLLAEKLVGYSVFMSELYRDHIGDVVPKERIFNNTPDSVKQKPWFRTSISNTEGELLPGRAESDQFDSYNTTTYVKLDAMGNVIRPRVLVGTRKLIFTKSSTTERYDNITGKYSIARYAKIPRLNIVLKYEHDLDAENPDGSIKDNNFTGALDLLLQFKPFHVHIENLEVRYSLSEYVFDQTNISSESLNTQEQFDAAVDMTMDRAENTITFSDIPATDQPAYLPVPADNLDNRGVIATSHVMTELNVLDYSIETSLWEISKYGLPTKAFYNDGLGSTYLSLDGNDVITREKFMANYVPVLSNGYTSGPVVAIPTIVSQPIEAINYTGYSTNVSFCCAYTTTITNLVTSNTTPIYPYDTEYITVQWYKDAVLITPSSNVNISNVLGTSTLTVNLPYGSGATYYCKITRYSYVAGSPAVITQLNVVDSNSVIIADKQIPVHAIVKYDLTPVPYATPLDYKTMLSAQHDSLSYVQQIVVKDTNFSKVLEQEYTSGLTSSSITAITASPDPYRASVTTLIDSVSDTQSISSTISRPWDLKALEVMLAEVSLPMTSLEAFKYIYDASALMVLEYSFQDGDNYSTDFIILDPGIDYYFDNKAEIFLNSVTISAKLTIPQDNYNFLFSSILHAVYLTRTTYNNEATEIQGRGFRQKYRVNTNFTRQFLVNTLPQQSLQQLMPTEIVSIDGKTKEKTVTGVKKFKAPTNIYNRSSLKNEHIDNYTVVTKDPLIRTDKSKWEVYSPEYTAYWLGDQKITNNWWGNYYNVKIPNAPGNEPAFIPYADVDTSTEAQLQNSFSDQWLSALSLLNLGDPNHFLATRKSDTARTSIWNRNSCKSASVPFIRSRRDNLQVFRKDIPTFTRSEVSSDYAVNTLFPNRLDNYKYILPDGTDVSLSYFDPSFTDTSIVSVSTDTTLGQKAIISNYDVITSTEDGYYNSPASDVDRSLYYSQKSNTEYYVHTSLYAGNMPVDKNPIYGGNIDDTLDELDILITNLAINTDIFTITDTNNTNTSFNLSRSDIFVSWTEKNTGDVVAFGYYPASLEVIPSVKVFLNGILLSYSTQWLLTYGAKKSVSLFEQLSVGDVIRVEYQILSADAAPANIPPTPQIPESIDSVVSTGDVNVIVEGNRHLILLPLTNPIPVISWYDSLTSDYISSGTTPIQYQPMGSFEEAAPDVKVFVNGFLLKYKLDWWFLLHKVGSDIRCSIALSPAKSNSLIAGDTIRTEYFSTI